MRKRDEFEDDGRTIADMSGIVPQRTFLPRRKPREDAPSGEGFDLTPKEKRWAALGAMKAVLMIAGAYLLGLGVLLVLVCAVGIREGAELLRTIGFRYYTVFEQRKPTFLSLE